eukprot:UN13581
MFDDGQYLEPHWRLYRQSEADFYRHSLPDTEVTPDHLSADLRLAVFQANTLGVKYGVPLSNGSELSFRVEIYRQSGDG